MSEVQFHIPDFISQCLSKRKWQPKQRCHQAAIAKILDPYLEKRQRQYKDPILDFLFEYYAFRPSHLKRWSPGVGILLRDASIQTAPSITEFTINDKGAFLDPKHFPENRKDSTQWILRLLKNSLKKTPSFGCFGMHEWAMVYKSKSVRHNHLPLRMQNEALTDFVESRPLVCTHFDAYRFFSERAKPMNKFDLSRETFANTEQPGCLHTNMDLYKWSFKLFPWISSKIIRTAFLLAIDTRTIDMKASPYDLRKRGLKPIKIETEEGRLEYVKQQKKVYRRSVPIREKLISECQNLIDLF